MLLLSLLISLSSSLLGEIAPAQAIPPITTHFSVAWSVCLSGVCLSHPCPLLNHLIDLDAIWQVHLWGPMTHCVRLGFLIVRGRGDLVGRTLPPQPKHAIANCCQTVSPMLPSGECKQVILPISKLPWSLLSLL